MLASASRMRSDDDIFLQSLTHSAKRCSKGLFGDVTLARIAAEKMDEYVAVWRPQGNINSVKQQIFGIKKPWGIIPCHVSQVSRRLVQIRMKKAFRQLPLRQMSWNRNVWPLKGFLFSSGYFKNFINIQTLRILLACNTTASIIFRTFYFIMKY